MRKTYRGKDIEVTFDLDLCIHVAECLRGDPKVFQLNRRPWALPDAGDPENVAEVIERCPSGALLYRRLDGKPQEDGGERTTVTPIRDGPLLVRGRIEVTREDGSVETLPRATLCRCGQSEHKPFCDNRHLATAFRAPGVKFKIHLSPVRPALDQPIAKSQDPRGANLSHDVERFSRWAPEYDRHWLRRFVFEPVQRKVIELAASAVPQPAAILDVGCGTGRLLRTASERFPGAALNGVDAAEGMVNEARAHSDGRYDVQLATAEHLPFPAGRFDLVFSTMTFHHWSGQAEGVAEIARVLAPRGRWVLADVIATGGMRYIRRLLRITRLPERKELDAMLESTGLRVLAEARVRSQISVLSIGRG